MTIENFERQTTAVEDQGISHAEMQENVAAACTAAPGTNTIIQIGSLGDYRCYLNVPREEAIRRYQEAHKCFDEDEVDMTNVKISEFTFTDEFYAYEAGAVND